MTKIFYVNNDGGGFAANVELEDGTTVGEFFAKKMSGRSANDFLIRVNREPTTSNYVFRDGDRCTIAPRKISGAVSNCG